MYTTKARDIMTRTVVTIREDQTLAEAARLMLNRKVSCLPVLDRAGDLVGILTHTDFTAQRRHLPFSDTPVLALLGGLTSFREIAEAYRDAGALPVAQVMKRKLITAAPDTPVGEIVEKMVQHEIKRVPVVDAGKLVGIISRHDLLKLVADRRPSARSA
ncbi:MAG: CBS domain-containing protein [Chloroflexi bacterium]|nr:CBS domain-containing protein [Chloroflexota bacterium]